MTITAKIKPVNLPNFVSVSLPGNPALQSVDVADLSTQQLMEIAEDFKVRLLEHATTRKKNRDNVRRLPRPPMM